MSKLTLYNITSEQFRIYELLEELGGEFTPEIEEALALNHENFLVKSEGYIEGIAKYRDMKELANQFCPLDDSYAPRMCFIREFIGGSSLF